MKIIALSSVLILFSFSITAQEIEVINVNPEFHFTEKATDFYYLSKLLDSSRGIKVADVRFTAKRQGGNKSLVPMFYKLYNKAMSMGANAFFVPEMSYNGDDKLYEMSVELWSLNNEEVDENMSLLPKNLVVIIGNMDTEKEDKGKGFKINKQKMTVMPYSYIAHENALDEKTVISIGGFMGASVTVRGAEDRYSMFVSFGGVAVAPTMYVPGGGVGVSISTGRIYPVNSGLGFFLMDVLDMEKKERVLM